MSHLLVVLCRQSIFVRFLFEVCWLLSFFSPEVPVQGELVRARGFRSRVFKSALVRLGIVNFLLLLLASCLSTDARPKSLASYNAGALKVLMSLYSMKLHLSTE